jgi:hypothetical protein
VSVHSKLVQQKKAKWQKHGKGRGHRDPPEEIKVLSARRNDELPRSSGGAAAYPPAMHNNYSKSYSMRPDRHELHQKPIAFVRRHGTMATSRISATQHDVPGFICEESSDRLPSRHEDQAFVRLVRNCFHTHRRAPTPC